MTHVLMDLHWNSVQLVELNLCISLSVCTVVTQRNIYKHGNMYKLVHTPLSIHCSRQDLALRSGFLMASSNKGATTHGEMGQETLDEPGVSESARE